MVALRSRTSKRGTHELAHEGHRRVSHAGHSRRRTPLSRSLSLSLYPYLFVFSVLISSLSLYLIGFCSFLYLFLISVLIHSLSLYLIDVCSFFLMFMIAHFLYCSHYLFLVCFPLSLVFVLLSYCAFVIALVSLFTLCPLF